MKTTNKINKGTAKFPKTKKLVYNEAEKKQTPGSCLAQDWMWYAEDQEECAQLARFAFTGRLGDSIDSGYNTMGLTGDKVFVPTAGIMRLTYTHKFGMQQLGTTALYKASRKYFDQIARGFTSFPDVEAADVFFAVLAQQGPLEWIHMSRRAFKCLGVYSKWNKYKASALLEALGFKTGTSDSIDRNIAEFRNQVNKRIKQFNDFCVIPDGIASMQRAEYYCSQIFTDVGAHNKANFIVYVPEDFYLLDSTSLNTGTCLKTIPSGLQSGVSLTEWLDTFDLMMDFLMKNGDVVNITQVLGRVYDSSKLIQIARLSDDEEFEVSHSDLAQNIYHNITPIPKTQVTCAVPRKYFIDYDPTASSAAPNDLILSSDIIAYQDEQSVPRAITVYDYFSAPGSFWNRERSRVIDLLSNTAPNPEEIIDVTSQMTAVDWNKTRILYNPTSLNTVAPPHNQNAHPIYCRDTIVTGINIYYYTPEDSVTGVSSLMKETYTGSTDPTSKYLKLLSQFDFSPIAFQNDGIQGELINFTQVTEKSLIDLHSLSQFALFAIPSAAKDIIK